MKLYISGPMTGIPEFNYPAFHEAKAALEARGYDVISPADLAIVESMEWIDYILLDIDSVFSVEGVATLDGFQASKGARIEVRIAQCLGLPVMTVGYWLELAAEVA